MPWPCFIVPFFLVEKGHELKLATTGSVVVLGSDEAGECIDD
jgi:hypothetical protein